MYLFGQTAHFTKCTACLTKCAVCLANCTSLNLTLTLKLTLTLALTLLHVCGTIDQITQFIKCCTVDKLISSATHLVKHIIDQMHTLQFHWNFVMMFTAWQSGMMVLRVGERLLMLYSTSSVYDLSGCISACNVLIDLKVSVNLVDCWKIHTCSVGWMKSLAL